MTVEQIRPKKPRRSLVGPSLIVLILLGGGGYAWKQHQDAEAEAARAQAAKARPVPAVPVSLASADVAPFPVSLTGLGTVQAYNTVLVRTRIDGQIDKVAFREGQMVKKGDLLVEIDPRPYQATLEQAKAKKAQDEAMLANSKADLQRYSNLGDYATRQQLDTQKATVAQQTAQLTADQAAIDNAQTQVSYATVTSPIDGMAGFRQVDIGNIVNASTQTGIVTLTQMEPISVVFTAPEDQLPDINKALAAGTVPVSAYTSDGARKLADGKLELVNNQVDTTSGTIRLKAVFDNKDHALWPGLSVTTRMQIGTLQQALTIPDTAVQHGPNGLFAYTVDGSSHAHVQKIAVGLSGDGRAVVTQGLTAGQKVVSDGQYRVQEGVLVADRQHPTQQAQAAEIH